MLMGVKRDSRSEHNRLFVLGVVFIAAMAAFIALTMAIYQKAFQPVTWVEVEAERAGLQLPQFGDVRMHGVIVGQVREIEQDGSQAVIKLGLDPSSAEAIPSNVSVEIKPTTLFGQKYVEFVDADTPAPSSLSNGSVIPSSRVRTSVELESILARLFPVLNAVRPQDLNSTLHALATGLAGNGEKLGQTLEDLDGYLERMNVHLPTLHEDVKLFAEVADTYAMAAPDLVDAMKNATTTARTVSSQRAQINGLLSSVTGTSSSGRELLAENEDAIAREGDLAVPLLKLLDDYSPEYPCLLKGLDRTTERLNEIFRDSRVSQTMVMDGTQRKAYGVEDRPVYGEVGHGPWCLGLPNPQVPIPPGQLKDGAEENSPWPAWQGEW